MCGKGVWKHTLHVGSRRLRGSLILQPQTADLKISSSWGRGSGELRKPRLAGRQDQVGVLLRWDSAQVGFSSGVSAPDQTGFLQHLKTTEDMDFVHYLNQRDFIREQAGFRPPCSRMDQCIMKTWWLNPLPFGWELNPQSHTLNKTTKFSKCTLTRNPC